MTTIKLFLFGLIFVVIAFIYGCGLDPIEKGQAITLGPNDGIAAVVMDTLDPITQIKIVGTESNGVTMDIPNAPVGVNMYLFVVPAGHYCLSRFNFGMIDLHQNDQKHGVCFDVIAGKIAYSGNISPRAYPNNRLNTDQDYDWKAFQQKLKDEYPELVAKYPVVTP